MKRRTFIKYTSLGVSSSLVVACSRQMPSEKPTPKGNFGKLEKTNLTLAYVPSIDAAPLIIAEKKGFFSRYGLTVTLAKKNTWKEINKGLLNYQFDAAQTLYGMPILSQLNRQFAPMISLMVMNLNGGAIALDKKAWNADIRPSFNYTNFGEFSDNYRAYIRSLNKPQNFAIDSAASIDNYLLRYWLAAMGIDPDKEINLTEIEASQMFYKLQAGAINGYSTSEPYNQKTVSEKTGFIAYINRDIWKGHPGKILATMQPWADKNPVTARSLMAALLEACQFCERTENHTEIAQILSQSQYLNTPVTLLDPPLTGKYNYGKLEDKSLIKTIPDFNIFHYQKTSYLKAPDQANYPWRSQAIWLLTQMIRWHQIEQKNYPKNADKLLDKMYPVTLYEEVAKALKIPIPQERMKLESATVFIDQRPFDPSQPVAYLNQFEIRANKPQLFTV